MATNYYKRDGQYYEATPNGLGGRLLSEAEIKGGIEYPAPPTAAERAAGKTYTFVPLTKPKNDPSLIASQPTTPTPTTPAATTQSNTKLGGEIMVDSKKNLYAVSKDGTVQYIPDQHTLEDFVFQQGYADTRKPYPEFSQSTTDAGKTDNQITYPKFAEGATGVLVQFTEDPTPDDNIDDTQTIWRFDVQNKTYRPFASIQAIEKFYGKTWSEIGPLVQKLSTQVLNVPEWGGDGTAKFLSRDQAIQNDGRLPGGELIDQPIDETYGQTANNEAKQQGFSIVDGLLKLAKSDTGAGIAATTIDAISKDVSALSLYTNALTYGGYNITDVLRDIKRKDLISKGNTDLKDVTIIHPSKSFAEYQNTPEYQAAISNTALAIPPQIGGIDSSLLNYSIFKIPQEAYNILVPPLPDPTTPEFREMMDNIKSAYHDILIKQLDAKTTQDHELAKYDWDRFRDEMQRKFNIQLTANVTEAWKQIEGIGSTFEQRGVYGSGLYQEATDQYLRDVRRNDDALRAEKLSTEEETKRQYYLKNASPLEIQNFINSDPATAQKWGLVPSDEMKQWFSKANLKALYPDLQDWEIDRYISTFMDENGNYRSQLYQTMMTNKLGLTQEKEALQASKLQEQKTQEEEKAYAEFTKQESPFLRAQQEATAAQAAKTATEQAKNATDLGTSTTNASWQLPTGYEKISGAQYGTKEAQQAAYQNIQTDPTNTFLYGQPKTPAPVALTPTTPTPTISPEFQSWTTGKTDILGKSWQGYEAIKGPEYQTPEQRKLWQNVQQVGSTLYGYRTK